MIVKLCTTSLLLAVLMEICHAAKRPSQALIKELTSGYDSTELPDPDGDSVRVVFGLFIDILVIDELNQDIIADAYIHETWNDTRLTWNSGEEGRFAVYLTGDDHDRIWQPGIFLPRSSVTAVAARQDKLTISSTGRVKHEYRATIKTKCYMNYSKFPFDTQTCGFTVEMFKYTEGGEVTLESSIDKSSFVQDALKSESFTVADTNVEECTFNCSNEYPSLSIQIKIKRDIAQSAKQLFIPSALLMACLYVNFYLGHVLLLPRSLYIVIIAMLMCTHSVAVKLNMALTLPDTNVISAYEVWIAIYFAFLVLTLIVYCVVAKLCHKPDGVTTEADNKHMRCGDSLDMTMRVLYPVVYLIFVIGFFAKNLLETESVM